MIFKSETQKAANIFKTLLIYNFASTFLPILLYNVNLKDNTIDDIDFKLVDSTIGKNFFFKGYCTDLNKHCIAGVIPLLVISIMI